MSEKKTHVNFSTAMLRPRLESNHSGSIDFSSTTINDTAHPLPLINRSGSNQNSRDSASCLRKSKLSEKLRSKRLSLISFTKSFSSQVESARKYPLPEKLKRTISFKYRRNLIKNRQFYCIASTTILLYGLIASLAIACVECEIDNPLEQTQDHKHMDLIRGVKITVSITSVLSAILAVAYHYNEILLFKFDNNLNFEKTFIDFQYVFWVCLEVGILRLGLRGKFEEKITRVCTPRLLDIWNGFLTYNKK